MLKGKHILLSVTGSIAAYKIASLASALKKQEADITVLMTKNATNFINPITFETLTGRKCLVDTFDRNFDFTVEHVSIAKQADIALVAPASADVIGKLANGIADDMLTTTLLACRCPVLVAPAMNTAMFENSIVQDNLDKLRAHGVKVIDPATGYLACGDTGAGKMPEPEVLLSHIVHTIGHEKDFAGKRVLIAAHGNSLRSLVKQFDGLSEEEIVKLNLPTGVPLVYTFDKDLNVLDKKYLGDPAVIEAKINKVANQGKAK